MVNVPGRVEMLDTETPYQGDSGLLPFSRRAGKYSDHRAGTFTRGRLIALFGCGGDRDHGKRPIMGEIAGRLADFVHSYQRQSPH